METSTSEKTEPTTTPGGNGPTLGFTGWLRFLWRQLTSMRTALWLLLLLAIAAIPGAIFPQRGINPGEVVNYLQDNPTAGEWLDRLGFFSVYSSVWFSAIYLLLFISLVGCIVPRIGVYAKGVGKPPGAIPARLTRMPAHTNNALGEETTGQTAITTAAQVLRKHRYRVRTTDDGLALSAERGYLREAGNLVFHISLVGLLIAVASSSLFGYSGQALVPVGETFTNSRVNYDSFMPGSRVNVEKLPKFSVRLDHFDARFEESSVGNQFAAPRDFDARLTVTDPDGTERSEPLIVNKPVPVANTHVFLAGNGYAPEVTVTDGDGNVAFSGAVPFIAADAFYTSNGVVKVPDAKPAQLGLQSIFLPTAVDGKDGLVSVFPDAKLPELVFSVFSGDLGLDRGVPQSAFRLDTRRMELLTITGDDGKKIPYRARLRPGDQIELPDGLGSVRFDGFKRFAALSVRHDPGKVPALVFGLLIVVGLCASLMVRRRRVWFVASAPGTANDSDGTRWVLASAGLSDSPDPHLTAHLATLTDQVLVGGARREPPKTAVE